MTKSVRLLGAALALAAAACSDVPDPSAPDSPPPAPSLDLSQTSQDPAPSQLAVARAVPGFGGYFLDASGAPSVWLIDPAQRPAAEQALAGFLTDRGFTAADLRVLPGTYEYTRLDGWYRQARAGAFSVAGILTGDVDEGANRLRFGVASPVAAGAVQAVLAGVGVPASAALVEQRAGFRPVATLRDRVRPVSGGLQINFFAVPPGLVNTPSLLCTLGFNVERFGIRSFITNSHCSNVEGGEETPTDYYQNLRSGLAANRIGIEVDDRHWNSQLGLDCPPPLQCRYSDALRAEYAAGVDAPLGRIAKVDEITTTLADTTHTIAGSFTIKAKRLEPVQGEVANKVGRTTGWTEGVTTATCVDVLAIGTNHIRLCQASVAALVDGGDSGSPVFVLRKGSGSAVTLVGILWGRSVDEANPEFSYSPMGGIERELGELRVF